MTCFHIFRKQNLPCGGTGACPPDHPGSLAVKATFRKPRQSLVCANLAANLPLERFALENICRPDPVFWLAGFTPPPSLCAASELRRHRRRGGVAASVSLRLTPGAFSKREYSTVRPCCPPNIFCIILLQPVSMRERSRRGRNSGRKLMPDSEWVRKKAARGSAVFLRGTGCFTMLSIRALPAGEGAQKGISPALPSCRELLSP